MSRREALSDILKPQVIEYPSLDQTMLSYDLYRRSPDGHTGTIVGFQAYCFGENCTWPKDTSLLSVDPKTGEPLGFTCQEKVLERALVHAQQHLAKGDTGKILIIWQFSTDPE